MTPHIVTWVISALAVFGVIVRPFRWPEYVWAIAGALLLVLIGAVPFTAALGAAAKGADVYLFLIGMMLLSEVAREAGLQQGHLTYYFPKKSDLVAAVLEALRP